MFRRPQFADLVTWVLFLSVGVVTAQADNQSRAMLLGEAGLDSRRDLYIANVIKCRPPQNRKPTRTEIERCLPWLHQQLELVDPPLVVLAGATALQAVLGIKGGISKLRGQWIEQQGRAYLPVFHPSYLLRFGSRAPGSPQELTLADMQDVRRRLDRKDWPR